jgi:hypothetical protein
MRIIKNTSVYQTKKLKKLFGLIHYIIALREGRLPKWKQLRVVVRNGSNSGYAFYPRWIGNNHKGWDMFLSVGSSNIEGICQLFAHELMHNYGYKHRQFRTDPLDPDQIERIKREICESAEDLKI